MTFIFWWFDMPRKARLLAARQPPRQAQDGRFGRARTVPVARPVRCDDQQLRAPQQDRPAMTMPAGCAVLLHSFASSSRRTIHPMPSQIGARA